MNTSITYVGLQLKNPLIAAASFLSDNVDSAKKLEDAGVSAVTMHSLFEEEINSELHEVNSMLFHGKDSYAEALSFFPENEFNNYETDNYVKRLEALKKALDIPVIASLNGISMGGWLKYAKTLEESGADAIELNIYFPNHSTAITSEQIEKLYIEDIKAVVDSVALPVIVKLAPYFTSLMNFTKSVEECGANAVTLFNRFYSPDIDLDKLEWTSNLYTSSHEDLGKTLRSIAHLYGQTKLQIAASGGVKSGYDMIKTVMAGADVASVATALIENGAAYASDMLKQASEWMEENEYESFDQMRGSISYQSSPNPSALERSNYVKLINQTY